MRHRGLTFVAALLLAGAAGLARAEDPATDPSPDAAESDQPATRMQEVVVHDRADNLVGTADSASEGAVGNPQIESRPLLRPAEILETVPGLIATQHSGTGKANQYFLRGFNLDHGTDFATFVGGVPMNLPHATRHGQGYTDLNFLIPELVQRASTTRRGPTTPTSATSPRPAPSTSSYFDVLPQGIAKRRRAGSSATDAAAARRFARRRNRDICSTRSKRTSTAVPGTIRTTTRRSTASLRFSQRRRGATAAAPPRSRITASGTRPIRSPLRAIENGIIDRLGAHRRQRRRRIRALRALGRVASRRRPRPAAGPARTATTTTSRCSRTSPTSSTTRCAATSSSRRIGAGSSGWCRPTTGPCDVFGRPMDNTARHPGPQRPDPQRPLQHRGPRAPRARRARTPSPRRASASSTTTRRPGPMVPHAMRACASTSTTSTSTPNIVGELRRKGGGDREPEARPRLRALVRRRSSI